MEGYRPAGTDGRLPHADRRDAAALALLCLLAAALLAGTPGYPLDVDEPWIAEWAWFQAREGTVRSELFRGYENCEEEVVVYHRLIAWAGTAVIRVAGFGLGRLRAISLFCSLALAVLMCLPSRGGRPSAGPAAVLFLMPAFFRFARIYRPEAMLALLGWACWMAVDMSVRRRSIAAAAAGGALSGLCVLSHLDGAAFAAAGAVTLAWRRKWLHAGAFAACSLLVLTPAIVHAASRAGLFAAQFTGELAASKTTFGPATPLLNLLSEHERLFREPGMILITLSTASAAVIGGWRRRREECPWFYEFAGTAAVALAALSAAKGVKYGIPIMPFAASEIWLAARGLNRETSGWRRWAVATPAAMLAAFGLLSAARETLLPRERLQPDNAAAGDMIPAGASCAAPFGFVFDEIEERTIHALYLARLESGGTLDSDGLARFVRARSTEYAVIDGYWRRQIGGSLDPLLWDLVGSTPGGQEVYRLRQQGSESTSLTSCHPDRLQGFTTTRIRLVWFRAVRKGQS